MCYIFYKCIYIYYNELIMNHEDIVGCRTYLWCTYWRGRGRSANATGLQEMLWPKFPTLGEGVFIILNIFYGWDFAIIFVIYYYYFCFFVIYYYFYCWDFAFVLSNCWGLKQEHCWTVLRFKNNTESYVSNECHQWELELTIQTGWTIFWILCVCCYFFVSW